MNDKILFVDDEQNVLDAYKRQFHSKYKIITAESGADGISALKEQGPFAVIVSDFRMPGMDGIQFLSKAREISPDTVRIMLTGYADMNAAIDAINKGNIFRFLTKPCPSQELNETIILGIKHYNLLKAEQELQERMLKQIIHEEFIRKSAEEELKKTAADFKNIMKGTIQAMAFAVEKRDPHTAGHQHRVAHLAGTIAVEMGLSEEEIEAISLAAAIHDIGKLYVPAEILNKPGKLDDMEFAMIKNHPQVGYDILNRIKFPWPIVQIVIQHHERLNGTGYPAGISGKDIILGARIIAVADVIEAVCFHRSYRPALGIDTALEEISKNRGVLYDEEVVDICLKFIKIDNYRFDT
ncbi:MAG: two-component system response regulator [Firmicutes bacterium HGW-Firmicutes-13]|nr:MAG: two-component system response regulator [Firmicutes bacterium HGW-Firmicutes-13]